MFTRPEQSRFWLIVGFVVRRRAELTVITVGWLVLDQLETKVTPGLPGWMRRSGIRKSRPLPDPVQAITGEPASHYQRVMTGSERMPVLIERRI